ncbi:hypothetical protein IAR55_004208 [Kwoniella newhampshirensis]|uniref:Uncharacterized protein n=1 Tax=Kwoniella newhampshirensis TaxID=1651941 RepID=A0AAW0YLZ8_9TREE
MIPLLPIHPSSSLGLSSRSQEEAQALVTASPRASAELHSDDDFEVIEYGKASKSSPDTPAFTTRNDEKHEQSYGDDG